MEDPDLLSNRVRSEAGVNSLEGIGVSEAPRGTLFHHYNVDENGLIEKVNLIIATGHNNLAMNKTITQIAKHYIQGEEIPEGFLNRVEAGIRCYDPCLSCSTHAAGQMPLHIQLLRPDGDAIADGVLTKAERDNITAIMRGDGKVTFEELEMIRVLVSDKVATGDLDVER
jgi:NAD-reducing hydrogenase large subunit